MVVHVYSRFLIGNNQKKLERELLKQKASGKKIVQVVNNFGAFTIGAILLSAIFAVPVYTIIVE